MVATKMVPNKRRGGFNGMPGRQRFKPSGPRPMGNRNLGAMFDVNQLGDNPGFVDFNDDVQIPSASTTTANTTVANSATTKPNGTGASVVQKTAIRKGNASQKRPNVKNAGGVRRIPPGMGGHWGPPMPPMPPMFPIGGGRRNGPPIPPPPPHFRVPPMGMRGMRGGPMMPPPPPNGRFGGPPMGLGPLRLIPRPIPPIPPMRGPIMNPMGRMMPPPLRGRPEGAPIRRIPNGKLPSGGRVGKVLKGTPQGVLANGRVIKTPIGKKTKPKVIVKPKEEYPLDKPWVTDEIKAEHDKKCELAERLKGNKDDALFAQFKTQRDKFVKMYDAARLEFIGKHPEQDVDKILTESAKTESQKSNDAVSTDTPAATDTTSTTTSTTTDTTAAAVDAAKPSASSG